MDIISLIVRTTPARLASVRSALIALPGVDIHTDTHDATPGDGRLIVTVEDTAGTQAADVLMDIHRLDGVLSATLVFQYADSAPAGAPPTRRMVSPGAAGAPDATTDAAHSPILPDSPDSRFP